MADINSTFVQNIFNLAISERIPHINITAKRMISGEVLRYLDGFLFTIRRNYGDLLDPSSFSDNTVQKVSNCLAQNYSSYGTSNFVELRAKARLGSSLEHNFCDNPNLETFKSEVFHK